jgi:hypothetical protein
MCPNDTGLMSRPLFLRGLAAVIALVTLAACGQQTSSNQAPSETAGTVQAGGDIPDNVVWLNYSGAGFTIQYPEGWVRNPSSGGVTFSDKDSRIAVSIASGSAPTKQSATADVNAIPGAKITAPATDVSLPSGGAIKLTYQVDGNQDPVTGKRPRLTVDRYVIASSGRVAVIDLAAQVGVDNADAYLAVAKSFKWSA